MHEFKSDPDSLCRGLNRIEVRSPVIINQMMRAIALFSGPKERTRPINTVLNHDSPHSALFHYFRILIDLDILPDKNTFEILWGWTVHTNVINPVVCVQLVQEAKSLKVIDWILRQLLFRFIEAGSFPQFDEEHNRTITSRIWNLRPDDFLHQLYVFRLLWWYHGIE